MYASFSQFYEALIVTVTLQKSVVWWVSNARVDEFLRALTVKPACSIVLFSTLTWNLKLNVNKDKVMRMV